MLRIPLETTLGEEARQQLSAFCRQHPTKHLGVMIQTLYRKKINDTAMHTGFWIARTINDARNS